MKIISFMTLYLNLLFIVLVNLTNSSTRQVSTSTITDTITHNHDHKQTHADTNNVSKIMMVGGTIKQKNVSGHTGTHPGTYTRRLTQSRPVKLRHTQSRAVTVDHDHTWSHLIIPSHTQTHPNTPRHAQTHPDSNDCGGTIKRMIVCGRHRHTKICGRKYDCTMEMIVAGEAHGGN